MDNSFAYQPATERYERMLYKYCGRSGLKLPLISLGLWHNFGSVDDFTMATDMIKYAFDHGITHFDLANNYGPPAGAAERNFGKLLKTIFAGHRDELVISTKAGYDMWEGPYGEWGSRKYLLASLDQSLQRLGLDYVDIFYHHRPDPETPLEETMGALAQAVQSGKALYVGLSNYDGETMSRAAAILEQLHCPFIINQNRYSILDRVSEKNGILSASEQLQKGVIIYSPLAQGMLTDRYLHGIPEDSRIRTDGRFLQESQLTEERLSQRQVAIKPLVDALFVYLKQHESEVGTEKLKDAFSYALNQEKYLRVFLTDGDVPMDNNASERAIRGFCVGKKNWQMIDTINGAKASAIIYSIAETAKANNLKPYEYFEHLLTGIPKRMDDSDRSFLDDLLPWSKKLPDVVRKPKKQ